MRVGTIAETALEQQALARHDLPLPLFDTMFACVISRALMAASKYGVFDALKNGPRSAAAIAVSCGLDARATQKLAYCLTACGYLEVDGQDFHLAPVARKWLLADQPDSIRDVVLFNYDRWARYEGFETYLETGTSVSLHASFGPEAWARYQNAMRALTTPWTEETAAALPAPANPKMMLDIGGSHGGFSAAACRRYPSLCAEVLDLAEAVEAAAPMLAAHGLGARLTHRVGDALTADIGTERFDIILMSQVAHHLTADQNRGIAVRAARALKPGGIFAVLEQIAAGSPAEANDPNRRMGVMLDFYFGAMSTSSTWTATEIRGWQSHAGLRPLEPIWLRSMPGVAIVPAVRSS